MKQVRTTNPELVNLIRSMKKKCQESEARIWHDIADFLSCSRRSRRKVNLSRLNRYTKKGETVAVPGKVLGAGKIDHPIKVAAFAFSQQAQAKILKAKGKCLSLFELMKKNPKGTDVKIIG
jgi:large subunit ribosomal protein L18e